MRRWFCVRVRENGVKKSRFYLARNSGDAAAKYKGPGFVMWATKVSKEQAQDTGEFFQLGDDLLRDFAGGENRRGKKYYSKRAKNFKRG